MTTTATATFAFPTQRTAAAPNAAELRYVTLATHRNHRHQLVLDNLTVSVPRGEVVSVLSRHDDAAAALLDVLDGRIEASWGSVRVAGRELTRLGRRELARLKHEHIARVVPAYGVHARLSVRQNLLVAQRRSGRPTDLAWVDQLADVMGLHGKLGYRSPDGADPRRVRWAIARAMVARPSLLLVKDVTGGLDRADEQAVLGSLKVAARLLGGGVVLATRDPITASRADRVVLLNRGQLVSTAVSSS